MPAFNRNMDRMKLLSVEAHAWLEKMDPRSWSRAYFHDLSKSDILLNNNCEVFNKYILEARELPILSMMEKITSQLMKRLYEKQKECLDKWTGPICPKIMDRMQRNVDFANMCFVFPAWSWNISSEKQRFHLCGEHDREEV